MSFIDTKQVQLNEMPQEYNQLLEAGVHIGHIKSKTHPKMKQFILGRKNDIQIIDVQKTAESLSDALKFITNAFSTNKDTIILFVSTKPQFRAIVKEAAEKLNMPHVIDRWIGGTFTNFKTISKRLSYYKDLEQKKESGELKKYTKKEQMLFEKELKNLEEKMGGIKHLTKLPEIIFVIDVNKHKAVIAEAHKNKIPVIAITDTDADPSNINYPIFANDHAIKSVKYILDKITNAILEAKESQK